MAFLHTGFNKRDMYTCSPRITKKKGKNHQRTLQLLTDQQEDQKPTEDLSCYTPHHLKSTTKLILQIKTSHVPSKGFTKTFCAHNNNKENDYKLCSTCVSKYHKRIVSLERSSKPLIFCHVSLKVHWHALMKSLAGREELFWTSKSSACLSQAHVRTCIDSPRGQQTSHHLGLHRTTVTKFCTGVNHPHISPSEPRSKIYRSKKL